MTSVERGSAAKVSPPISAVACALLSSYLGRPLKLTTLTFCLGSRLPPPADEQFDEETIERLPREEITVLSSLRDVAISTHVKLVICQIGKESNHITARAKQIGFPVSEILLHKLVVSINRSLTAVSGRPLADDCCLSRVSVATSAFMSFDFHFTHKILTFEVEPETDKLALIARAGKNSEAQQKAELLWISLEISRRLRTWLHEQFLVGAEVAEILRHEEGHWEEVQC